MGDIRGGGIDSVHDLIVIPRVPLRANFREIGWGEVRLGKMPDEDHVCEDVSQNRRH